MSCQLPCGVLPGGGGPPLPGPGAAGGRGAGRAMVAHGAALHSQLVHVILHTRGGGRMACQEEGEEGGKLGALNPSAMVRDDKVLCLENHTQLE